MQRFMLVSTYNITYEKVASMELRKLLNPTYGMPPEHKDLIRQMKLYAGGKRKAVKLVEKVLEIRKNGYNRGQSHSS